MSHDAAMGANPEADRHDDSSDQRLPSLSILMPTKNRTQDRPKPVHSPHAQQQPPTAVLLLYPRAHGGGALAAFAWSGCGVQGRYENRSEQCDDGDDEQQLNQSEAQEGSPHADRPY